MPRARGQRNLPAILAVSQAPPRVGPDNPRAILY